MILNTAPQDEAVLSNVGQIGEFRIRNSAKAFNILSSGLYANKIKAIIRELSCNAVDSHTAAGNTEPFEVHLPTQLEPWFAVRDFGTGLSHEQVTNIYTTYFESTKTTSNDFIGALGLGSKSPFSYTDNFTVTAIQNGRKGIYSAFINAEGVPSIALMMEENTDEPNGVEVKFSVNDRWDFDKFRQEARNVFRWFKALPKITGAELEITPVEFADRDIIPGVHTLKDTSRSFAIMGNIAYPIEVPNADTNLGELANLLNCGLVMEFAIGELDFQASREGLSYIPETIASIQKKLCDLNAVLVDRLTADANAITNLWERAFFLDKKDNSRLWKSAVRAYVKKTDFALFNDKASHNYFRPVTMSFREDDLAAKYNIVLKGFHRSGGMATCTNIKASREYDYNAPVDANGLRPTWMEHSIMVREDILFVVNDTKKGALERAKYHARQNNVRGVVYVLEAADRNKPVKAQAFFKALHGPRTETITQASMLDQKERTSAQRERNVQILHLERRDAGRGYSNRSNGADLVWRDAAKLSEFDDAKTYYYMPINGYVAVSKFGISDVKQLVDNMKESGLFPDMPAVYGVRRGDLETVQSKTNWINLEDHVVTRINSVDQKIITQMALNAVDNYDHIRYNSSVVSRIEKADSPFRVLSTKTKDLVKLRYSKYSLEWLCQVYTPGNTISPAAQTQTFVDECEAVYNRYPLLKCLGWKAENHSSAIAEYINLIDAKVN